MSEHSTRYRSIVAWLGRDEVRALIPVSRERIREALQAGDEHLNTISLASWDSRHGYHPQDNAGRSFVRPKIKPCPCCKQPAPSYDLTDGMWGLVRKAIERDRKAGRPPLLTSWSLSNTVSALKQAARDWAEEQ